MSDAARIAGQVELSLVGHRSLRSWCRRASAADHRPAAGRRRSAQRHPSGGAARPWRPPVRRSTGRGSRRSDSRSCGPDGRVQATTSSPPRPCRRPRWSAPSAPCMHVGRRAGHGSLELGDAVAPRASVPCQARSGSGRLRPAPRHRARARNRDGSPSSSSSVRVSALPLCPSACGSASLPPVQHIARRRARPSSRRHRRCAVSSARCWPNSVRGFSTTSTRAVPSRAITRRRITARSGLLGSARASRHSIDRVGGDPAASPDQAARLVVAAPHDSDPAG